MVATRFAVATHILLLLACGPSTGKATSEFLARSVNTNPVVVRRITGQLARAGLIRVRRGPGGAELARPPEQISLGDVWRAVHADGSRPLLPLHASPDPACPVGRAVHHVLGAAFEMAEAAMEQALHGTTLASLVRGVVREPEKALAGE
ncbi:MAG TPA: Rrf2 family transcriptional regulator [Acetobacteraceae bacterium]|nr:Rrf2 family transcriptional regulator [Acetobacteraceae bacterium]